MGIVVRLLLAGVLVAAAVSKLAAGREGREALATFGLRDARARAAASTALIATELVLAIGVGAGIDLFAWLAALLMLALSGALVSALVNGRRGRPCACFGSRSRVSWAGVARNLVLAAGFAAVPFLAGDQPTTEGWLAIGLVAALPSP
ncbi:MAG: MauE/DoxX family redox-associated membrane protein [Solirubrobacterales bacterium]